MRIITIPIPSWTKHHQKRGLNDRVLLMTDWRNHTTELERVNNQIDLIAQRAKNILGFVMVEKGIWKQIWRLNVVNTFKSIKSSLRLPQSDHLKIVAIELVWAYCTNEHTLAYFPLIIL